MAHHDLPVDDPEVATILAERAQVTNLAYRLLGTFADAEDVFQATLERWLSLTPHERRQIWSAGAWCSTVASRICLDILRSARHRREVYVGQWLPEPVPGSSEPLRHRDDDPGVRVAVDESLTMAFLVVLDTMTPAERVAFVLHDVYAYPFPEIAQILDRSPAACRQLAASGRRRIRHSVTPAHRRRGDAEVVHRFRAAWDAHDIQALVGILDPDIRVVADGGGRAAAARVPILGRDDVTRFLMAIARKWEPTSEECLVNELPGLVIHDGAQMSTVYAFEICDGQVRRIWAMRNPEKLTRWAGR